MKFRTQQSLSRAPGALILVTVLMVVLPTYTCAEQSKHAEQPGGAATAQPNAKAMQARAEHSEQPIKLSAQQREHAGIEIVAAAPGRIASTLELPGQLVLNADRTAHIVAQFDGTVREVRVSLGASVEAGAVLAVIDSRELADLSATYLSSSARLELAALTLKREQALWEQKISAEQDFLAAKQSYAEAQIEQRQAKQKLKAFGVDDGALARVAGRNDASLARFEIKAPIAGAIIEKDVTLGEAVTAGDKLFELADLNTVWLDISVFPKDLSYVGVGQVVRVTAAGVNESTTGTISYVQPLANTTTRAVLARVVLKNPDGRWRPGLFVTAIAITTESDVQVAVAKDALQSYEAKQVVFVETGEGLTPRSVKIGRSDGVSVEILAGLQAGERYVSKNSFVVKSEMSKGEAAHED